MNLRRACPLVLNDPKGDISVSPIWRIAELRRTDPHCLPYVAGSPPTPRLSLISCPVTAWCGALVCTHLMSRPQNRGGCRRRSRLGPQHPDGFPGHSGVSAGRGLLRFSERASDERGPGHQTEWGSFQCRGGMGSSSLQKYLVDRGLPTAYAPSLVTRRLGCSNRCRDISSGGEPIMNRPVGTRGASA